VRLAKRTHDGLRGGVCVWVCVGVEQAEHAHCVNPADTAEVDAVLDAALHTTLAGKCYTCRQFLPIASSTRVDCFHPKLSSHSLSLFCSGEQTSTAAERARAVSGQAAAGAGGGG
jgi:hypothetical protein